MKLIIDTDELAKLKDEAGKIKLEPEAEQTLTYILELENALAEIKEAVKAKLLEEGKKLNPNFKSWEADNVKVSMRAYGTKYYVSEAELELAPRELFKTEVDIQTPNVPIEEITHLFEAIGCDIIKTKSKDGTEKLHIKRVVDSKAVDKWIKQQNGLPTGIGEIKDRPVSLTFSLKGKEANEQTQG